MEIPSLQYWFFPLASFGDQAKIYFGDQLPNIPQSQQVCTEWLTDHIDNHIKFYESQHRAHKRLLFHKICKDFDTDPREPDYTPELRRALDYCYKSYDIDFWEQQTRLHISNCIKARPSRAFTGTFEEIGKSLLDTIERRRLFPFLPNNYEFSRYWFNSIIYPVSPWEQKRMAKLKYATYLRSDFWLRVRAAMLIAFGGRCRQEMCWRTGESWLNGDEQDIHVHHLHYPPRGTERFDDLTLLCHIHHKQWHINKSENLPQINIYDM